MIGWAKTIEETAQMLDAVGLVCKMSDHDYGLYQTRRARSIANTALRAAIYAYSADFGELLEIISRHLHEHAHNPSVPTICSVSTIDLSAYRTAWTKHITTEKQSLLELAELADTMRDKIIASLKTLRDEDIGGEYSSYSDYSEETDSESEEEDCDDDDDDDDDDEEEEDRKNADKDKSNRRPHQDDEKHKDRHRKHRN